MADYVIKSNIIFRNVIFFGSTTILMEKGKTEQTS